ncbi:MAG TPA: hypothetical protein PLI07_09060 [Candidatus Hydrogenedentes bacterium]|nr:hypothetical protein [Candidatus Hydrogenedentota bacterium]
MRQRDAAVFGDLRERLHAADGLPAPFRFRQRVVLVVWITHDADEWRAEPVHARDRAFQILDVYVRIAGNRARPVRDGAGEARHIHPRCRHLLEHRVERCVRQHRQVLPVNHAQFEMRPAQFAMRLDLVVNALSRFIRNTRKKHA